MKNSIVQSFKDFFKNLFGSKKLLDEGKVEAKDLQQIKPVSSPFSEEKEQLEVSKLARLYMDGKIKEEDMTEEQIDKAEKYFDEQIASMEKQVASTRNSVYKSLVTNKKVSDKFEKFKNGEIEEDDLTEKEIAQLDFICDYKIAEKRREINKSNLQTA